jgi:hypothetical protein
LVRYGQDQGYESYSSINETPMINHVVTLTGLTPNSVYNFQIDATAGGGQCPAAYSFRTTNFVTSSLVFNVTNVWKYSTNQLDGTNWPAPTYNDAAWRTGSGLLWADTRSGGPNPAVQPKGTQMPTNKVSGFPFVTYYFRTHFTLPNNALANGLSFSNYIDDGAVFYLNGVEIYRLNLPASLARITNGTLATASSCGGDATCPVLFDLSGDALTNLLAGDNVLAVEVHNVAVRDSDITFGCALRYTSPGAAPSVVKVLRSGNAVMLYWNGTGLRLQEAAELNALGTGWGDVSGPVTTSPYIPGDGQSMLPSRFYRLRRP